MAKADTVNEIKQLNDQTVSEDLTQKQLDELKVIAERDGAGKLEAFNSKLAEYDAQATKATPKAESTEAEASAKRQVKTIQVRVNDKIAGFGGEFTDLDSGETIGKEPKSVEKTAFVAEKLRSGELIEVD